VSHELRGWRLEDSARVEFYKMETSRQNLTGFPAPGTTVRVDERHEHTQGANTFNVSKQIKEWLSVSSGYLYSRLEGNASLQQNTFDATNAFASGYQWFANNITLKRESQVVSFGSLVGPWSGLTLSAGVQGEWTRQESMGSENLLQGIPTIPPDLSEQSAVIGQLDSASARENVSLRFVKIPWTVVFAEARLRQENLGRYEQRPDGLEGFTRDTDADIESQEYRAGFNTSPWSWFSLSATYKDNLRHTDYTHLELFNPSGHVYPGFLLWRDIEDNQFETRLVLRPASWLKTSFNYRIQETDFNSATAAVTGLTPGGPISAGNFEAHVYSLNAVLTPFRQLYFSGTLTYSDTRTRTEQNGDPSVVPYEGDVYNLIASANYILNQTTDLHATYLLTRADYAQNNGAQGLPLGMDFVRHGFMVGMNKRLSSRLTTHLQYTFYRYWEPQHGEVNEYAAHGVFATVAVAWP